MSAQCDVTMSTHVAPRDILNLGMIGRVPTDTLFELYLQTELDETLVIYQTRCTASLGGWVYNGAACLAKYLESDHFRHHNSDQGQLAGKRLIELGAGTGVVGIMAAHHGADVVITDLESLVPLIQYNVDKNAARIQRGTISARPLFWGSDDCASVTPPDYLILANCVYYESSMEPLLKTLLQLTDNHTTVLACYEERVKEIKALISRWHDIVIPHFHIEEIPSTVLDPTYAQEYVRLVKMIKK